MRRGEGRIEIVFSGDEETTRIDVDLAFDVDRRLLGLVEDIEAVVLDLLAKLQAQGYVAARGRRPCGLSGRGVAASSRVLRR